MPYKPQGPEEMCLSLEHQSPSKTSEKMGYFDRVTVSLHILQTANQETEGSQDRLTKAEHRLQQIYKDAIGLINRAKRHWYRHFSR